MSSEWAEAFALLWRPLMAALGLVAGSFANVCIHRLPLGQSVVHPRSRCPRCAHAITALENVPVLSFVALRGRCRGCGQPIAWRYPAVEALCGLLWLGVALVQPLGPRAILDAAFLTALVVLALIDVEHQILPDAITKPGIGLGWLASLLPGSAVGPLESLLAAAGGYLALALVAFTYRLARGEEGLGRGDWKMAAMLGAFLGWQPLLLVIFVASLGGTALGLVLMAQARLGSRPAVAPTEPPSQPALDDVDWRPGEGLKARLPLGTLLALAALPVYFRGSAMILWYKGLFVA